VNHAQCASAGLIVLVACAPQAEQVRADVDADTTTVEFAVDTWPGEGIPVIEMRREVLVLRTDPELESPVVDTLRGRVGQRVAFDSTRYQTMQPGAISFPKAGTVTGRDFGSIRHLTRDRYYDGDVAEVTIPVPAGDSVEFLQHRAEGTCFVRIAERIIDAHPCPQFGRDSVRIVRQPVTQWWIRARGQGGAFGWLLVSDSTALSVRREF
jgi:hypothetical protein